MFRFSTKLAKVSDQENDYRPKSAYVDVTLCPRSIYDRQRRRALNTRRALCVELAKSSLLALELQKLAAG